MVTAYRTLGASFTIKLADLKITRCHHQPRRKKIQEVDQIYFWLVVTLGDFEIGHDDRETYTQGALNPAA
ncbi:predicted protein [Lichtheimia corymbifera JMRC:FSU:9682]|uniref:Uncharacterized protein n=1 Tax=Lichtheimia corymbifera JMRC:FSU:9682 TaxID=1263082 RepID=A0A068S8U7_9FUNG|nr:predicted protein [Lichtheimia corymbifera JMRC:FSU:9682]